ncbi:MAG: glycoside hydrolase family 97 catalytic domain-containing protein [Melioribacteraceae bacterium]
MKLFRLLILVVIISFAKDSFGNKIYDLKSPNEKLSINFWITENGEPVYTISSLGITIIKQSKLGVIRSDGNFSADLVLDSVSNVKVVNDNYKLLHGKRLECNYSANKKVFYLKNSDSKKIEIIFQLSDDGVAFRYHFPEKSESKLKIFNEVTSYHFDISTKAFLQPCPEARTGWSFSQPSYEEYYQMEIPVGTVSPFQAGWVLPALFNYNNYWISITETAVDTNYCGTRLSQFSPDGEYSIQFPQPQESKGNETALPESTLPWLTPWRIIAISENLGGLVESTIGTDLAIPQKYDVTSWLKPGIASWSWVILKDDSTNFDTQKRFIDFASKMNWEYCLIDAFWDKQIGYEKIKELAGYAKTKNVKILLWYNSAGDWNTTPLTPHNKMISKESRRNEFQKLQEMGIGGIKVDFFGGDGQSMMKYYIDILKDAADYKIAVNFHGCTLPRGWYRTYPNLVSMESIRGEEYVTFDQSNANQQAAHCSIIPFTRNLFDPMDFTPVNFSGIPNINRKTTGGFEIALSVLFTSGIQHIAETPKGMSTQKDFIQEYMKSLPERWEDVKFIEGYPGKYIVLARKSGNEWYIAGINGENTSRKLELNFPFLSKQSKGTLTTDADNSKEFINREIDLSFQLNIELQPNGGFVIKTLSK